MPEKFNGEGIIDVLGRQRSTTKLEAAIRLLGKMHSGRQRRR